MQVYLLRHGIAEEGRAGKSDAERELTAEGRRRLKNSLAGIASVAEICPSLVLSSPFVRAMQTARIAAQAFHYRLPILETKALIPSSRPERVWDELRVHSDEESILLVGHDPLFTSLSGYLLNAPALQVDFKKVALMRVDIEAFGAVPRGTLRWFATSRLTAPAPSKAAAPGRKMPV